jgi:hypothetical protein
MMYVPVPVLVFDAACRVECAGYCMLPGQGGLGPPHSPTAMRDAQRPEEESGNPAQIAELWVQ